MKLNCYFTFKKDFFDKNNVKKKIVVHFSHFFKITEIFNRLFYCFKNHCDCGTHISQKNFERIINLEKHFTSSLENISYKHNVCIKKLNLKQYLKTSFKCNVAPMTLTIKRFSVFHW